MTINLKKATRNNPIYARSTGWVYRFAQITHVLALMNEHSIGPEMFARRVAQWQSRKGLTSDGMLGPKSWRKMQPETLISVQDRQLPRWLAKVALPDGRELIGSESDVRVGWTNDAYDLKLFRMPNGDYELILSMNLQFFFIKNDWSINTEDWTEGEMANYIRDWKADVTSVWHRQRVMTTADGSAVSLHLAFNIKTGGWWAYDHWEITVEKLAPGQFETSYVNQGMGNTHFDSNDLGLSPKGSGHLQHVAAHEFGHMIGLGDEYNEGHKHFGDSSSALHSGNAVRPRHLRHLRDWVKKKLDMFGVVDWQGIPDY